MFSSGKDAPEGRRITRELISDHHSRLGPGCREHTPQEGFGGVLIMALLHQDVQDDAVFVHGPP